MDLQELLKSMAEQAIQRQKEEGKEKKTDPDSNKPPKATAGISPKQTDTNQKAVPEFLDPPVLVIPRGIIRWMFGATIRDAHGLYFKGFIE